MHQQGLGNLWFMFFIEEISVNSTYINFEKHVGPYGVESIHEKSESENLLLHPP